MPAAPLPTPKTTAGRPCGVVLDPTPEAALPLRRWLAPHTEARLGLAHRQPLPRTRS
ncbi:MAG: hypothetical protein ABSB24_04760 [Gaiellaceae bacterium]